jgi:DNA polymerase
MTDDIRSQLKAHLEYFRDMGIEYLEMADTEHEKALNKADMLDKLWKEKVDGCTRCKLSQCGRQNIVFGEGNPDADLMFVGEGPGRDEDIQGLPFVGRAGQKLNDIIRAMGMDRKDVYIANIVKCRPPGNRNPESDEIEICIEFLKEQIAIIQPKVLCSLGSISAHSLLGVNTPISKMRNNFYEFCGIPLMPTFHPAYLLRNYTPTTRKQVWDDMQKILKYLESHSA